MELSKLFILSLLVGLPSAFADSNVIKAPYDKGEFYEEPDGFRPSMKGADRYLFKVQNLEVVQACFDQNLFAEKVNTALAKHTPSPILCRNGPEHYPEIEFSFEKVSNRTFQLTAKVFLWLPGEKLMAKEPEKILSFQYHHKDVVAIETKEKCIKDVSSLIQEVVDAWMANYFFYNNDQA